MDDYEEAPAPTINQGLLVGLVVFLLGGGLLAAVLVMGSKRGAVSTAADVRAVNADPAAQRKASEALSSNRNIVQEILNHPWWKKPIPEAKLNLIVARMTQLRLGEGLQFDDNGDLFETPAIIREKQDELTRRMAAGETADELRPELDEVKRLREKHWRKSLGLTMQYEEGQRLTGEQALYRILGMLNRGDFVRD